MSISSTNQTNICLCKKLFSPQPIRTRSSESNVLCKSAYQQREHLSRKKSYSQEHIAIESFPNELSSFSFLPTFNQLDEIGYIYILNHY